MTYAVSVIDHQDATDQTPQARRTVRVGGLAAEDAAALTAVVLGLAPAQPAPGPGLHHADRPGGTVVVILAAQTPTLPTKDRT